MFIDRRRNILHMAALSNLIYRANAWPIYFSSDFLYIDKLILNVYEKNVPPNWEGKQNWKTYTTRF